VPESGRKSPQARPQIDRIPPDRLVSELPESARALLDAARRLLVSGGWDALRWDAIAEEAGQNKAMIKYHFADKRGLVVALLDSLVHDATIELVRRSEDLPLDPERVHEYVNGARRLMEEPDNRSFFDLLPHVFRDARMRATVAELYRWYREMNMRCLTVGEEAAASEEARVLAAAFIAAVDGLAIQEALDPDGFDATPVFAQLESWISSSVRELEAKYGGCRSSMTREEGRQ
jgi:AcrR family transcriptional regulator